MALSTSMISTCISAFLFRNFRSFKL